MLADEILIAAWLRGAPNASVERGFPRGFWPDVARAAVEMALAGSTTVPLSFRQTISGPGNDYAEGRAVAPARKVSVKGLDLGKLEFKL